MELQVGVKALLKNSEGKFLLLRRNTDTYRDIKGEWDIVGGRIRPGTPFLENLKREIQEETSLTLQGEPELVAAQDILRVPGKHVIRLTFVGAIEGEPHLNEESAEFAWVSPEELKAESDLDIYVKELIEKKVIG